MEVLLVEEARFPYLRIETLGLKPKFLGAGWV